MDVIDHKTLQRLFDVVESGKHIFDLGICGSDRVAIAGTGMYRNNVGKLRPDTYISEVFRSGRPVVLENKNRSYLCMRCPHKQTCPYKGSLVFPLKFDDQTIGAIYLLSEKALSSQIDIQSEYLNKFSSFVMDMITHSRMNHEYKSHIDCLANLSSDGLMTMDRKGRIRGINLSARKIFNILPDDLSSPLNIINFLPDLSLKASEIDCNYKDSYKVRIRPIADIGHVLQVSPKTNFDMRSMDFIVGRSEVLQTAKERACVIARSDSPVLLAGETGTGKELFAQAIHRQSSRGSKNLITIDCSAIPGNLLESELFGYMEGAFTGAKSGGKKGKIEASHLSSIFLDEIGELPLALQSKFLRFIESSSFDKLGDHRTTYVNTRIIAATNRDLRQMVQAGTFREDLYYRLNVMPLEIPPLRARGDDIDLLSDYFLKLHNVKFKRNIRLDAAVRSLIKKYEWPGNVRELKNIIEYGAAFTKDDCVVPDSLPGWFKENAFHATDTDDSRQSLSTKSSEKDFIEKSLMLCGRSTKGKMEAARLLGISLATLYRKIQKYKLQ